MSMNSDTVDYVTDKKHETQTMVRLKQTHIHSVKFVCFKKEESEKEVNIKPSCLQPSVIWTENMKVFMTTTKKTLFN